MSAVDSGLGLIGREHPAALLRAEITRGVDSHGGLVLVTGEAGIGKTALVTAAADEARRLGALVLGGACWDSDSAPGYWPWVQVIRGLRRGVPPEEWAQARDAAGDALTALLGESQGGGPPAPEEADGFRLYDAVTSALVAVSQRRPVVVVLDDLHWADAASLRLLEFAAQHTWFERVVLIGTYRDVEVETEGHPLRPLLSPLLTRATVITLTGLGREDAGRLLARTAGVAPSAELVAEVHRRTGGNPFFIEQTARLWRGGGSLATIPPGVRDAVMRRLSQLAAPVVDLLTTAAVLGREFHRQVLAAVTGEPVAHVDRLLDQAVSARLVTAGEQGRFAFAHDLVRETLYGALDDDEAARRHAAVVHAVDRTPDLAVHMLPADVARHAHLAGAHVAAERAVAHMVAAAQHADMRLAMDESLGHYRRALERAAEVGPGKQAMIAVGLGRGLHHRGDHEGARRYFEQAAELAWQDPDPAVLGRVALTVYGLCDPAELSAGFGAMLAEAHTRLVGEPREPGARLSTDQMALDLTAYYAAHGRRGGDDEALLFGLWARHDAIFGPGTAAERLALIEELMGVARRTAEPDSVAVAASLRWVTLLELGDPRYLDRYRDFKAHCESFELSQMRLMLLIDGAIIALLHGRLDEAQRMLEGIRDVAVENRVVYEYTSHMLAHLWWALRLARADFDAIEATHQQLRRGAHPCPDLAEAITALRRGDVGVARRHLTEVTTRDRPYPRQAEAMWLRFQAEAAAACGDPELCAKARADIEPYAGQWGVSIYGWELSGPMDLWLGVADAALGRWDEAVAELTAARRSAELLQARPYAVEADVRLAQTLLARGASGDAAAAATLLGRAEAEATDLGLREVLHRVRRIRAEAGSALAGPSARVPVGVVPALPAEATAGSGGRRAAESAGEAAARGQAAPPTGRAPGGPPPSPALASEAGTSPGGPAGPLADVPTGGKGPGGGEAVASGLFRFDEVVWTLGFAGRTVHLPDAKGLHDLHTLLGSPGTDLPAVKLLDPAGGDAVVAARRMGGDPVLDEEAKTRYRRRLARLDEEIDRAVHRGDDDRAAELDAERAALLAELRSAAGLGGRTRRLGDEAERARKTVTARIRDILRKLDNLHPELAAHLRATVSTGSTCRYRPDREIAWQL